MPRRFRRCRSTASSRWSRSRRRWMREPASPSRPSSRSAFRRSTDAGERLAVRHRAPPATARDRAGRDVRQELAAADGVAYRTDSTTLRAARAGDVGDFVDLTFPAPAGADTVALVLRLRNSLLNTVLLYDLMLGTRGARALDWVGKDLERVG